MWNSVLFEGVGWDQQKRMVRGGRGILVKMAGVVCNGGERQSWRVVMQSGCHGLRREGR